MNDPIECRAAVAISVTDKNEIVFLPRGLHSITPISGGIGKPIKVLVDSTSAVEMERQRQEITTRSGKRVYFDFNHEDGAASFWPHSFLWGNEGVVATGEWSISGRKAVEGKDFRAFSPVFHVDDKHKDPAKVVCCERARPNMGGLVNDPAFSNLPLWAKNDGSPVNAGDNGEQQTTKEKNEMTDEEVAALRAKNEELQKKIEAQQELVAKEESDASEKEKLEAMQLEQRLNASEIAGEALRKRNQELEAAALKRQNQDARAAVAAKVKAGAIPSQNFRYQNELIKLATADPTAIGRIIDPMPAAPDHNRFITRNGDGRDDGHVQVTSEDPKAVIGKMAQVLHQQIHCSNRADKYKLSEEFHALYAGSFAETDRNRDIRHRLINSRLEMMQEAIQAADVTDPSLGTLAGTLVTQRTLELLKNVFPVLTRFTTDFSDQPATFNQTIMTRIIGLPSVVTYSTATGWPDSTAGTTDVPVTLNNHKGIQITFNENLLASTMRRLFSEFAEASAYQLAKTLVDALYAVLTDANYTNNSVFASTAFNRAAVIDIGVALTNRGVPLAIGNRTMLLWPAAFGNLEKDSAMVQFATNVPRPEIMTEGVTPQSAFAINVEGFYIYAAPNMPSNNANLVGFAGSKSALCIVTRTPNDYASALPGSSYGSVQMVTDPDIGITVMQVQYVDHKAGSATSRIALMYGVAPGQTAAGQLIKANAGTGSSR